MSFIREDVLEVVYIHYSIFDCVLECYQTSVYTILRPLLLAKKGRGQPCLTITRRLLGKMRWKKCF